MTTTPKQNAVPSESPRDLKFNAGKIDEFVTSLAMQYIDRFGQAHYTIEGINTLAKQAINQLGWIPFGTFQEGAALSNPNQILKDNVSGEYYRWDGSLPKSVSSGSTPGNSGGVGVGAWVSVGDSSLRAMLATSSGASMVGYSGGSYPSSNNDSATIEGAIDRLNERVIYAHKYGVKADGVTDDTAALQALSAAVSAMANPVVVIVFPQGTSIVGAQQQAPNATSGYSFRPTYSQSGGYGWFYISGRSGITVIEGYGYTIKLNSGLKHGSFDPTTGNIYNPTSLPFRDTNYQASVGMMLTIRSCESVIVKGIKVDGNAGGQLWGGNYGDTGWQCLGLGIWSAANKSQEFIDVESKSCVADSWYFGTESAWTPSSSGQQRNVYMRNCKGYDSRRQGITIAGGQNFLLEQCQFYQIGRKATGAGANYSSPEACMDIETESGSAYDIIMNDCKLIDGRYTFVAASFNNPFARATLNRCTLRSNSDIAQIYTTGSAVSFISCLIEGSGTETRNSSQYEVSFYGCTIRNHINSVVSDFCNYSGNVGVMDNCYYDLRFDTVMGSRRLFTLTAGDITSTPTYPQKGIFRNNRIALSGNQDSVTAAANGRIDAGYIQFFYDMDVRFYATGLTGAKLVQIDTAGSLVNQRGVTSDSNKVVDATTGASSALSAGGYMLNRSMIIAANVLSPILSGATLGSNTLRWGDLFLGSSGINIQSPDGTKYRVTVTNAGALTVNPQP